MPAGKRPPAHQPRPTGDPIAERPRIAGYGIPKEKKGLLPWSHVTERLARAPHYWVCTVSPSGQPHATPVDGLWLDGRLYFGGQAKTRRSRNLIKNPAATVHIGDGDEAIILHGRVERLRKPGPVLAARLSDASTEKYGYGVKPEAYRSPGVAVFVFQPHVAFAWASFPRDATRWELPHAAPM